MRLGHDQRIQAAVVSLALALATNAAPRVAAAAGPPPESDAKAAADADAEATVGLSRVLVLPVRLDGELPPGTDNEVRSVLRANLVEATIELLPDEPPPLATDCDTACRQDAAKARDADYLVQSEISGDEDEFNVTVTLFDGATGEVILPFTDACSICGFVEVRDMVRLRTLDARAEIVRRRRAAVAAAAMPPAPECPVPEPVVEVVEVPKSCPAVAPAPPRSPWISVGWGLVGAGVATAAGGAVIIGLDEREAGCQDDPRGGECIPLRYTTIVPGAATIGVGVATALGGVLAVVLGRRAQRRKAEASVAIGPKGASVSFRF